MRLKKLIVASMTGMLVLSGLHSPALASVVLAGTRVIYDAGESEVTIKVTNVGGSPALNQVWLDNGDAKAKPESIHVPFTVTPPVFRLDAEKAQTLRIRYSGEPLPQDHESVFWLNVLEMPPLVAAEGGDNNALKLAFRYRIKLFYRPKGLPGKVDDAPAALTWHLKKEGSQSVLNVTNPTKYNISFGRIEVLSGSNMVKAEDSNMLAPGEQRDLKLDSVVNSNVEKVHFYTLNDYGVDVENTSPITAGQLSSGK